MTRSAQQKRFEHCFRGHSPRAVLLAAALVFSVVQISAQQLASTQQVLPAGGMEGNASTLIRVAEIALEGLHRTRAVTVVREMTFGEGSVLPRSQLDTLLAVNERLVYNTGLFNRVTFKPEVRDTLLYLTIEVAERWYLWPELIFELEDVTVQDWFENPDWQRVTYGLELTQRNLTGRNDNLSVSATGGFQRGGRFDYGLPFLLPKRLIGISVSVRHTENTEVLYGSSDGELLRVRKDGASVLTSSGFFVGFSKRYSQFLFAGVGASYAETRIADTLRALNPDFLYAPGLRERGLGMSVGVTYDTRDVRRFPLRGDLLRMQFGYFGLDPWENAHYGLVELTYSRFRQVRGSRFYTAVGGRLDAILGRELAFRNKLFLGNNGVRGFNSFAIDGTMIATAKFEFKYALIPRKIYTWKALPRQFEDFPFGVYPYAFADAGFVFDDLELANTDRRFKNKPLAGWGVGVDIPNVYDNLLRLEYAWNSFGEARVLVNFSVALR